MARHSDPEVEARILRAARDLWHEGGEAALRMRAVAKAAGTNTPAVYRRFRTREDILRALVVRYQQQIYDQLVSCRSLAELAKTFLDFAMRQPREYELMMSGLLGRMTDERPNVDLLAQRCAEWFGGKARDHQELVLSIVALAHGTAMLRVSGLFPKADGKRIQAVFLRAVNILANHRQNLRET
jgi:AcrR family transcriptional regulator